MHGEDLSKDEVVWYIVKAPLTRVMSACWRVHALQDRLVYSTILLGNPVTIAIRESLLAGFLLKLN
jgi:hypothetical protein